MRKLLRFAHHFAKSKNLAHHFFKFKNLPFIFKRIGAGAALEAWVDSSHQAPGGRCGSPGGGLIRLGDSVEHSAPLLVISCKTQASSAASELGQVARIIKAITGLRIYFRELRCHFRCRIGTGNFSTRAPVTWTYKYSHVGIKVQYREQETSRKPYSYIAVNVTSQCHLGGFSSPYPCLGTICIFLSYSHYWLLPF